MPAELPDDVCLLIVSFLFGDRFIVYTHTGTGVDRLHKKRVTDQIQRTRCLTELMCLNDFRRSWLRNERFFISPSSVRSMVHDFWGGSFTTPHHLPMDDTRNLLLWWDRVLPCGDILRVRVREDMRRRALLIPFHHYIHHHG